MGRRQHEPVEGGMVFEVAPTRAPRTDSKARVSGDGHVASADAATPTRLLVVDENGIMRDGLCSLLAAQETFEVVGAASDAPEALKSAQQTCPHVILVDLERLIPATRSLITSIRDRLPDTRVLVLSFRNDAQHVQAALKAGADGYVLKNDSCKDLFAALRSVAHGQRFVSPRIAGPGSHAGRPGQPNRSETLGADSRAVPLTERERQVVRLIAAGHRTREIAEQLSLSHKTVEKHRTSLMRKLGLRNASAVAAYAMAHGLGPVGTT